MSKLKIAVQKSGRLHQESLQLLNACGLAIKNGRDQLKVKVDNFPVELLYLRNADIPQYVEDGTVDVGIIGENQVVEYQGDLQTVRPLGFSRCRLSLAVPKGVQSDDLAYFAAKKIATSYPKTLKRFLDTHGVQADIHAISGSVEIAPSIGLADGICDIVSSGSTLFKNGLRETQVILRSQAVLVKASNLEKDKAAILDQLTFRIDAVLRAKACKYVLMNVPTEKIEQVAAILPVLKSPTILPLAMPGWSSLHSVIDKDSFWEVIDELKAAGAEDILVVPIDKMVV